MCQAEDRYKTQLAAWKKKEAQSQEAALERVRRAHVPEVSSLTFPPAVAALPSAEPSYTYRYRVTLQGEWVGGKSTQGSLSPAILGVTPAPQGARSPEAAQRTWLLSFGDQKPEQVELQVAPDWQVEGGKEVPLRWESARRSETRAGERTLPAAEREPLLTVPAVRTPPRGPGKPIRRPTSVAAYPRPCARLAEVAAALVQAGEVLRGAERQITGFQRHAVTVRPTGSLSERRAAHAQLARVLSRLEWAGNELTAAMRENAVLPGPLRALGQELAAPLRGKLILQRFLARWWQEELINPTQPERRRLVADMVRATAAGSGQPQWAPLLRRMQEVALADSHAATQLAPLFQPRTISSRLVTLDLSPRIRLSREVVDLRVDALPRPCQLVSTPLGSESGGAQDVQWLVGETVTRLPVPVRDLRLSKALRVLRSTEGGELEGAAALMGQVDPYNLDGVQIRSFPLQLRQLKADALVEFENEVRLQSELQALLPARKQFWKLEAERRAIANQKPGEDGTWWVRSADRRLPGLHWLLRRSVRSFNDLKGLKPPEMRVRVEAARFSDEACGAVAGLRVGSTEADLIQRLGEGERVLLGAELSLRRYCDGGLEFGLRKGTITHLLFRRPVSELLKWTSTERSPLTVTSLDYNSGILAFEAELGQTYAPGQVLELADDRPNALRMMREDDDESSEDDRSLTLRLGKDDKDEVPLVAVVSRAVAGKVICRVQVMRKSGGKLGAVEREHLQAIPHPLGGRLKVKAPKPR